MSNALQTGRELAGLSVHDLWVAYWSIGGMATPQVLMSYLDGTHEPEAGDYDVVAQAINDQFVDRQMDHPVPYADELP